MSRAISRESFSELKNYLGVYMQQGRVILDSDWNENQDIAVSFLRRLTQESVGNGSPNRGFAIDPVLPPPPALVLEQLDTSGMSLEEAIGAIIGACMVDIMSLALNMVFGPLQFFFNFPGDKLDGFESLSGFALSSTQGKLRIGRDRPYEGRSFLRLSGHPGTVGIKKTLPALRDLSSYDLVTFRYRLNEQVPGAFKFFIEDVDANRSVWTVNNLALAADFWQTGFAVPLDLRFRILSPSLPAAGISPSPTPPNGSVNYSGRISTFGGKTPMTWAVTAGTLPAGLTLGPAGTGDDSKTGRISGQATTLGHSTFTVEATDADGKKASQELTLEVKSAPDQSLPLPSYTEMLSTIAQSNAPTGTPADVTRVRAYGFEVYQDATTPLVWDFDDLRLGSDAIQQELAKNNFIIRGSQLVQFMNQLTLMSLFASDSGGSGGGGSAGDEDNTLANLLDLMNTEFDLSEPSVENAGRFYVHGLPCVQVKDVLYSEQADPNDEPLAPPPTGSKRKDLVYLDAWVESVTYVEDPEIREIALGGPDTTTRAQVCHRVRVAQGGSLPKDRGVGKGTLATEGSYTGQANRLFRVEIETPGNIGAATFRWSEDNASTIQRVLESVPPGATQLVVEDASAFHAGDNILIRKEFGSERHRIASVFSNTITLQAPTGTELAALPAASRVPNFTTFALDDQPRVERWNAFDVPISADPADATVSSSIALGEGVAVRFGGKELRRGDYWNFRTRYLAGDEASGFLPEARIEDLAFVLARGVRHHYAPLAVLTRDGDAAEPDKIFAAADRRSRTGNATTVSASLPDVDPFSGTTLVYVGALGLPPSEQDSKFLIMWSGDLFIAANPPANSELRLTVAFYNDEVVDPATHPDTGKIQDRAISVKLDRKAVGVEIPLQLLFSKSDLDLMFLPVTMIPTFIHVYAELNQPGFSVELVNQQITALELKKSH
jgi:hypothetical protein